MNSFILLSLLATVIAGKSPRLKFVVHGRKRSVLFFFFFPPPGWFVKSFNELFVFLIRVMCDGVDGVMVG